MSIDITILGFPYDMDTPTAAEHASDREEVAREERPQLKHRLGSQSFEQDLSIVDCGDIPITPFDAAHACRQMEQGYWQFLYHPTSTSMSTSNTTAAAVCWSILGL
ncbi:hypothetical protein BDV11DRAFT_171993 [Aspergillus similis]